MRRRVAVVGGRGTRAVALVALLGSTACGLALGLDGTGDLSFAGAGTDAALDTSSGMLEAAATDTGSRDSTIGTDTGSPPPNADTGVLPPPSDGMAPDEASPPPAEAGPPADSGMTPMDSSAVDVGMDQNGNDSTPADSSLPDTGVFVTDTGTAITDTGTAITDTGTPLIDAGPPGTLVQSMTTWSQGGGGGANSGGPVTASFTAMNDGDLFLIPVVYDGSLSAVSSSLPLFGPVSGCPGDVPTVELYYGYPAPAGGVITFTVGSTADVAVLIAEFVKASGTPTITATCSTDALAGQQQSIIGPAGMGTSATVLAFGVLGTASATTISQPSWTGYSDQFDMMGESAEWLTGPGATSYTPDWVVTIPASPNGVPTYSAALFMITF